MVSKKTRGLQWTFVWLINDDPKNKAPLPIHPDLKDIKKTQTEVDQPVCAFIPHAVAIREGQVVVAKNSSPVAHNIKWTGLKDGNSGNVIIPPGKSFPMKDLEAEKLPIQIECNIHPWMKGYVGVYNHPYFAVTDADGNFEIKNAPAGKYRVVIWNSAYLGGKDGRFGQPINIMANDTLKLGDLEFTPPKESP